MHARSCRFALAQAALLMALPLTAWPAATDGGVRPPAAVEVRAVPASARLGEPFAVEVRIAHAPEQRYELKGAAPSEDFELVGVGRVRSDGEGSSSTTFTVRFAAFKLGTLETPALSFEITEASASGDAPGARARVEITSSLPADVDQRGAGLHDVRPPVEVPVRSWRLVLALAVAAGLLLAVLLGYRLYRAWRARRAAAVPPPAPLDVRAIRALDALAQERLPEQQREREFYFRLSEIVRGYLGERFGFEALECTTPELLAALRRRRTPGLAEAELADFAHESDLVRYARVTPSADACAGRLQLAYRLVRETTAAALQPEPPSGADPKPPPPSGGARG